MSHASVNGRIVTVDNVTVDKGKAVNSQQMADRGSRMGYTSRNMSGIAAEKDDEGVDVPVDALRAWHKAIAGTGRRFIDRMDAMKAAESWLKQPFTAQSEHDAKATIDVTPAAKQAAADLANGK